MKARVCLINPMLTLIESKNMTFGWHGEKFLIEKLTYTDRVTSK